MDGLLCRWRNCVDIIAKKWPRSERRSGSGCLLKRRKKLILLSFSLRRPLASFTFYSVRLFFFLANISGSIFVLWDFGFWPVRHFSCWLHFDGTGTDEFRLACGRLIFQSLDSLQLELFTKWGGISRLTDRSVDRLAKWAAAAIRKRVFMNSSSNESQQALLLWIVF